ncbi:MAG: hypothetical protein CGU28_02950 [Candidatus Dactylopiibacterium carminicum]|uniref:Uncharacterized protein n=1 Tax=Candidatus Dactylopiibacterium carminicum TaxID=857335 RepID=A0A272EYD0_9RHOO|nr:hypothetical protein [Candidatus Dactylopiibacterium carminicum]KAF7600656.1 hypothetical protein BGI27_01875 [Candidatus Dactylopiibacterium carminicum]PAS95109.1 MAG: hypothetical protein CGU29_01295 [Candidatus Dactylopiibacterium carminicum]PAS97914.1 MAG: hypothetical protein CGU28_02950 [Candidatus Dactylopiibacterium carminicum]PAT00653.1 MAG: hypothetical protein BSR46_01885 [Candidatus Dactylopiibacterium carminicum]
MNSKLHVRTRQQAERYFYVSFGIAVACAVFVYVGTANERITGLILALAAWHLAHRFIKGPPMGLAFIEVKDEHLYFRNPSAKPARVDRIELQKLHSIELVGEDHLRYFECKLLSGDIVKIGPFERGPGEMVIAEWFYKALPDIPFHVHPSATPLDMPGMPPGL